MSILSELKKRAGPRVRIRTVPSKPSISNGVELSLLFAPIKPKQFVDAIAAAYLLVDAGLSPRGARRVVDGVLDNQSIFSVLPNVGDYTRLKRELAKLGVAVSRIEKRAVDVKALRQSRNLSQEDFAGRYGIDLATLRNWEQGRTTPDGPAMTLLQLIERDPEKIEQLLAS
jgi:DNA-binding transcriptional regulator YiaG